MGENGMTDEPKPKSDGRFQKGHPGYRRKGTPNKFTKDVKQWLLEAAMNIGLDGQGKNGGAGFSESVGRRNPEALLAALTKLLPKNDEDIASTTNNIGVVNIVAVPADRYLSAEDIQKLMPPEAEPVEVEAIDMSNVEVLKPHAG